MALQVLTGRMKMLKNQFMVMAAPPGKDAKRKKKNLPPRVLYLENLFFRIEGEIKEFSKQAKATYERNQC